MYSDFMFWFRQQPPETQQWTILAIIGEFAIIFIIGGIAEYIKRKKKIRADSRQKTTRCDIICNIKNIKGELRNGEK